jgi:hypothetical protein
MARLSWQTSSNSSTEPMDKTEFVNSLRSFRTEIADLRTEIEAVKNKQIHSKALRLKIEVRATSWFDKFESTLRHSYSIDSRVLDRCHDLFGRLIESSTITPSRSVVLGLLQDTESAISSDLLVSVLKFQTEMEKHGTFSAILESARGDELEYLKEAVECADRGSFRAAIILCWCAAVDRLHKKVIEFGLDKFNIASAQMFAMTAGRYKRFNKKFEIHNLSDLRMSVFDSDLLWVLEFLGLIDGNEHEKLSICFTMRNTCAHPGDAAASPENVASLFSDINIHVLQNKKLGLT